MPRGSGLPGAVVARSFADWPVVLAAWFLLVCATTLIVAGVVHGDAVALGGLRRAIEAAPIADRTVSIALRAAPDRIGDLDAAVRAELGRTLAGAGGEVARVVRSGPLADPGVAEDEVTELTLLASLEGIEAHGALIDGRWPAAGKDPVEVAVSEGAAGGLGISVGDGIALASRTDGTPVRVTVVGIWRADPLDAYWLGDPLELDGVESSGRFTTHGPLVAAEVDVVRAGGDDRLDVSWRGIVDPARMRVEAVDEITTGLADLNARLRTALPFGQTTRVSTGLPQLFDEVSRSILVSRGGVVLLTIQFGVLAGYAIILVAGMLVDRRRSEITLMRARGAGSSHLLAMAVGEAAMLAIPAALLAPFLAAGIVGLLARVGPTAGLGVGDSPPLSATAVAVAALTGIVAIVALALPTLAASASPAGARAERGRQARTTLPQRLGLDLALVALAGVALWQLRLYGAPLTVNARGVLGLDPLLVAAPAIGLLGGAVLALRIVPRIAELGERLLVRGRGLVGSLGGRQLARRPLRYTRAALLLMLAAAMGTLASAHAATWVRSQTDQAAFRAAADLRVVGPEDRDVPPWAVGSLYRSIDGVVAATPVITAPADLGRAVRNGRLLGVDPLVAPEILTPPQPDAVEAGPAPAVALAPLQERRLETAAVPLPGEPRRFAVRYQAAFRQDPTFEVEEPFDPASLGVTASLTLVDADGRILLTRSATGPLSGGDLRLEFGLPETDTTFEPAWPVRLLAVDLQVRPPDGAALRGQATLLGLESSPSEPGAAPDDWEAVPIDPAAKGWRWLSIFFGPPSGYSPPPDRPGLISIGGSDPLFGFPGSTGITFRLLAAPPPTTELPVIASAPFFEATGAVIGDVVRVTSLGQSLSVELVAQAGQFAPLDPASPFLVADQASLELLRFAVTGRPTGPDEWWLAVDPARAETVAAEIRAGPTAPDEVIGREALATELATDPVPLGLIGVLGLGSLAAMVFAGIAFLVSSTVSTSERLGELALLRALGLSNGQLSLWLALESVFLLVTGLVAGSGLGLVLAWLVLPFATLTQTGAAPIPAVVVIVPWESILPIYLAAIVLLVVSIGLVRRQLPDARVSRVLRARDD